MKRKKQKIIASIKSAWGKPKDDFFNLDLIEEYFYAKDINGYHLQEKNMIDLDFFEYFKFVDRTDSCLGQQYLFYELSGLNQTPDYLTKREKEIVHYTSDEEKRIEIQQILRALSTTNDYYFPFLMFGPLPVKSNNIGLTRTLQFIGIAGILLAIKFPPAVFIVFFLFLINIYIHYRHKKKIGNFAQIFSRLAKLTQAASDLMPYSNISAEEKKTLKAKIKNLKGITSKIFFLKTHDLQNDEFYAILWYFLEILKILTLTEVTSFYSIIDDIEKSRDQIEEIYAFIGNIDVAISIKSLREGLPYYSVPKFISSTKEIALTGIYHPLVKNCVNNDLHLKGKSLLLTGSNMSGKSTFIKAINLNLISAQVLNTSFCEKYMAPFMAIGTSMTIGDNLQESKSYFMEEVISIGDLIDRSESEDLQYLFTIDEVFKGTNTIERISAAKSILEYLNKAKNHLVLVSTHDIELTELLGDQFELYYFQESIEDEDLSFDYKLKQGILKNKNAINILEIADYPKEVVAQSRTLAEKFEREKTGYQSE